MIFDGENSANPTPPEIEAEEAQAEREAQADDNDPNPPDEKDTATPGEDRGTKESERENFGDQPPSSS